MRKLKVGDVLKRVKDTTTLDDNQRYKRVTIKMNHKGVGVRDIELGINIGTKSQFFIREGQFLLSKIDARNGAFGIVSPEADGAIITGNFWAFDVNQKELNIDLFHIMTSLPFFDELSKKASSGTTNRQYLDEKKFLAQEITLPPIEEQDIFITHFKKIQISHRNTLEELKIQSTLITKLRSSILSDAVSGHLVPQDPTDESASVLLERIKAEKERLIKEVKLKRDRALTPITADEIPYELPEGWVWCRFGNIINDLRYGTSKKCDYNQDIPVLRIPNVSSGNLDIQDLKFANFAEKEIIDLRLNINDLLLIRSNGSSKLVGRCVIVDQQAEGMSFAGYLVRVRVNNNLLYSSYLKLVLDSVNIRNHIEFNLRTTSGVKNINTQEIFQLKIPLPPLEEQYCIVAKVEKLMATCDALEVELAKSRAETDRLMQTILKEAFEERNEIDV